MTKTRKITITAILAVCAIALIATASFFMINKPKQAPIVAPVKTQTTSSTPVVVVPNIETPVSSETVSSFPTEIKVEGSPTSKPTEKPNTTQAKPTPPVTTGNGYDQLTGTYPKVGDTMLHPIDGAKLTWTGTSWMAESDGGKSGDGQSALDQAHEEGYTGKDIGAD